MGKQTKKQKQNLRNCHGSKKTKEKQWLNAMWFPGLDLGKERGGHEWKSWWNPDKVWCSINSKVPMTVSWFWQKHHGNVRCKQ